MSFYSRCSFLFKEQASNERKDEKDSFFRACLDHDLSKLRNIYKLLPNDRGNKVQVDESFVKLETDGSVLRKGNSSCGGAIRDHWDPWISGFCSKLANVPPAIAEIMGMLHGLNLCWSKGFRKICLYSDCIEAINLATRGCEDDYPFKDLTDDIRIIIHRDWQVVFCHVDRELIPLADFLAKLSHRMDRKFCILDHPPPLSSELDGDEGEQGVSLLVARPLYWVGC